MNIVDSLVVTLGLDPSGFQRGQKTASDAQKKLKDDSIVSGKAIENASAKAGESVASLGRKFLALYALLTAGKGIKENSSPTSLRLMLRLDAPPATSI